MAIDVVKEEQLCSLCDEADALLVDGRQNELVMRMAKAMA